MLWLPAHRAGARRTRIRRRTSSCCCAWSTRTGGMVPPGAFLPAAERYDLVDDASTAGWSAHAFAWLARSTRQRWTPLHAVLHQPVRGDSLGRRASSSSSSTSSFDATGVPPEQDLLRDHRDRGHRQPGPGDSTSCRTLQAAGLPLRAGRLRQRPVLLRLPQDPAGGLPEDRRRVRQGHPRRPDRPGHGALHQRDRQGHGQEDHRRVRRE